MKLSLIEQKEGHSFEGKLTLSENVRSSFIPWHPCFLSNEL